MPTQKSARKWRCNLSRLLAWKITKDIHSCKPASLNCPLSFEPPTSPSFSSSPTKIFHDITDSTGLIITCCLTMTHQTTHQSAIDSWYHMSLSELVEGTGSELSSWLQLQKKKEKSQSFACLSATLCWTAKCGQNHISTWHVNEWQETNNATRKAVNYQWPCQFLSSTLAWQLLKLIFSNDQLYNLTSERLRWSMIVDTW